MLGIPTVPDRVVQAALKLVLEPIFEADFAAALMTAWLRKEAPYRMARTPQQVLPAGPCGSPLTE